MLDMEGERGEVEQVLEAVAATAREQEEALDRALALTNAALRHGDSPASAGDAPASPAPSSGVPGDERQRWWLAARLRLLQHQERLGTVLALHNGSWNAAAYAALRDCTVAEAASALAAAGRLAALPLLLQRHPRALMPSALEVLSCIPETVDPKQYTPLLRQVVPLRKPPPLARPADWAESKASVAALREEGQYALLLATEPMCAASTGWHPPTLRQVAHWACERAQQLDAATGQLAHAVALLEAAQGALHYGEPSVSALLAAAQELLSLVKLAAARGDDGAWRVDLRQYAALRPHQRLSLLLGLLGSEDLAADLAQLVAPLLGRLASSSSGGGGGGGSGGEAEGEERLDPQLVLRQALEQEAGRRLPWVVRVVQAEARQRAVFASAAQLARTAAACCYASTATDAWELLSSMLNAARDAVRADDELGDEGRQAAEDAVESARGHVMAARLLTKHGLTTAPRVVRDSSRADALRLLRTLLARVSRTKNTESRWVEVWMDLRSIQEHGFTQLSEEDVRTELCRTLLRVGQYRLCKSYLQGLPPAAAEQLVLAAGKEVYFAASGMADKSVKQAKECLTLLPESAAAREQLAGIAAAEQLQKLGLDLPPLQLQQLQARAASGDGHALEQASSLRQLRSILAEHPHLATADGGTLAQLAAALGAAQQQQQLLLRAAEAAHTAGDSQRAQGLLLALAGQRYVPAWELAASVAASAGCADGPRGQLLVFALSAAPEQELMPLLLRWEAADGDACWELFSAAESASSLSGPAEQQRQQEWLEAQLRRHYAALGSSASGACWDGEAAALGCLLALGPRGLRQWEQLAQEAQQRPLAPQQRRRALLLGLTAAGLLALQPADFDPAALAPAVAAAEARLAAPPAELLRLALLHRQEHKAHAAAPGSSTSAGEEDERSASAGTSEAGGSAAPTPRAAVVAAAAAEAAAAAAQRFNGMLASAADAEELQALLPGIDAAAALAGGSEGRRQLVLHMAATAARPPSSRPASAQRGASPAASPVTASLSPASSARRRARAAGGSSAIAAGRDRLLLRRGSSRKKVEDGPPLPPQPAVARGDSAADSALGGSPVGPQQEAAAMRGMLRQALQLANKLGVAAWEVHAAFVEALLLRPGQQWQPQGATAQLLEASAQQLLASQQAAAALLRTLLLRAWPAASSSCAPHLLCILQLLQRCGTALAASEAAAEGAGGARWQQAAALFAACQAGEQLLQAGGLDAKLFLQPIIDVLAEGLEAGDADEAMLPAAAAAAATAATAAAAAQQAPDPAALAQELLGHVSAGNAPQLAAAVAQLEQQYSVAAAAAANGAAKGAAASYPCSPSTVFLALFCKHVASGNLDADALQQCQGCLRHMAPAHAVAAAAFATTGGGCPLPLPADSRPLEAGTLAEGQQLSLISTALETLGGAADVPGAADPGLQQQVHRLRQRHALLAACSSIAAAWPGANAACADAARATAGSLQQVALAPGKASSGATSSAMLDSCLQQLLTAGCAAVAVLQVAATLLALQEEPEQPPSPWTMLLAQPAAAAAAHAAVAAAAESAVGAALQALAPATAAGIPADDEQQTQQQRLSPGDAVQNLFALLRSLHQQPAVVGTEQGADAERDATAAAAEAAAAEALGTLRLLVWQALQSKAATYDGSGGAAETEAHLQVLELLGTCGTDSMWPGWQPPAFPPPPEASGAADSDPAAAPAAAGRFSHHQALLFTRTAAALAVEWPAAVQECRLSSADFADAEAAEAALLRLAAAAEEAPQLRLLLRLLSEVLTEAAFAAVAAAATAEAPAAPAVSGDGGEAAAAPLHRAWSACLRALLPLGDLPGVLASLDEQAARREEQPAAPAPMTQQEAGALVEAADATHGPAAAASLALLLPYAQLQRGRWDQLLQACSSRGSSPADLAGGLPGLAALLLLVVRRRPGLLAELAGGGQQEQELLKRLVAAALLQASAPNGSFGSSLGGSSLTLRMALAASAAAHLAQARQYTAASWLAMQACGTPRLLQVLDSRARVLQQLLRSCAAGTPAAAGALTAADTLAAATAESSALPLSQTAAGLLRALPEQCSQAAAQLVADLQLQ